MSRGRPGPYRPDFAEQARKLCRNGATDRGIADILGVCVRTFYRWRAAHDDVAEALRAGKELADDRVQRALYERACGYDYDDTKIFHPSGAKEPVIVPIRVHVQADVGAARQGSPAAGRNDGAASRNRRKISASPKRWRRPRPARKNTGAKRKRRRRSPSPNASRPASPRNSAGAGFRRKAAGAAPWG